MSDFTSLITPASDKLAIVAPLLIAAISNASRERSTRTVPAMRPLAPYNGHKEMGTLSIEAVSPIYGETYLGDIAAPIKLTPNEVHNSSDGSKAGEGKSTEE